MGYGAMGTMGANLKSNMDRFIVVLQLRQVG